MKRYLVILIIVFIGSCEKVQDYSPTPSIKLIDFSAGYENTGLGTNLYGTLTFSFIDGDGNIGFIENSDTSQNATTIYDLFVLEYSKENGSFIFNDTIKYWLPYMKEGSYKKSVKGTIDVKLARTIFDSDTVYYDFYITDRDKNESNIITTPVYIYSELAKQ